MSGSGVKRSFRPGKPEIRPAMVGGGRTNSPAGRCASLRKLLADLWPRASRLAFDHHGNWGAILLHSVGFSPATVEKRNGSGDPRRSRRLRLAHDAHERADRGFSVGARQRANFLVRLRHLAFVSPLAGELAPVATDTRRYPRLESGARAGASIGHRLIKRARLALDHHFGLLALAVHRRCERSACRGD
jgi:hypothetical protein